MVARENYSLAPPGSVPKKVVFSAEIDEDILVSCNAVRISYRGLCGISNVAFLIGLPVCCGEARRFHVLVPV